MKPFTINGQLWRVVRVKSGSPSLIDRTNQYRLATTNPSTHVISINEEVKPPLLDAVLLHEITHAITSSYNLGGRLEMLPEQFKVPIDEWATGLVEKYGIEAATIASEALGRPVCVRGYCHD